MPHLDDAGLWAERFGDQDFRGRPALFLDRDGVVVEEVDFLRRPEDVCLIDDTAEAIAAANAAHIAVVVVTNQSGIARGYYDWAAFEAVQSRIAQDLAARGARLDMVLACGYHADGRGPLARDHAWRKPQTGMLLEARDRMGIDLRRSFLIGDRMSDIMAAKNAGLSAGALVATGYGAGEATKHADTIAAMAPQLSLAVGTDVKPALERWLRDAGAVREN